MFALRFCLGLFPWLVRRVASVACSARWQLTLGTFAAAAGFLLPRAHGAVSLTASAATLTASMSNGIVTMSVNKNGFVTSCTYNGKELIGGAKGFYCSCVGTSAFSPTSLKIVTNTSAMADVAYVAPIGELHYVLRDNVPGLYTYFVTANIGTVEELRTVYRVDQNIFRHGANCQRSETFPAFAELQAATMLQDETFQLADGTVYTKYNSVDFAGNDHVHGVYGSANGVGYGVWVIPASPEYYNAGPLRQEPTEHIESATGDSTVLHVLSGSHFGKPLVDVPAGKIYGPFFTYFNDGSLADARARATAEEAAWPYTWLEHPSYPLARTTVTGALKIADGRSTGGATVVLAKPGGEVYAQGADYIYWANCDAAGRFVIGNVRPGQYAVYAWATRGDVTAQFEQDSVTIGGVAQDLGMLTWTPPHYRKLLWQIGEADRSAGEFKLGDQLRQYGWYAQVPANLTCTIGAGDPKRDWYYAQTSVGTWNIAFNVDRPLGGMAHLTVALAATALGASADVVVNGTTIGQLAYPNDQSVYRSANQSGRYRVAQFDFPAAQLALGANTVALRMTYCPGYPTPGGLMYDTIKLELDDTPTPPLFVTQPQSQTIAPGASATLSAAVFDPAGVLWQWMKDGTAIAGATNATLTLPNLSATDAGMYGVLATNANGAAKSDAALLTVAIPQPGGLAGLSVRAAAGSGSNSLIVGLVLRGSANKPVLVRGVGPTLADYSVPGVLDDPALTVYDGNNVFVAQNDNWSEASNAKDIDAVARSVGEFPLRSGSRDAALLLTVAPGGYSAVIGGADKAPGVALVEIYDAQPSFDPTATQLAGLSTRAIVGTGANVLIVGFTVSGNVPQKLLIRAVGPGLQPYGVDGLLGDPQLTLYDSTNKPIAQNDNWSEATNAKAIADAATAAGDFPLSAGSRDSALLVAVVPGNYSAIVAGAAATTGVALVEIYRVN